MLDNTQLWESSLIEIESNVSKANFNTWFKNTYILKQEDGVVFLSVSNEFSKDWLYNKYHKFILKALRNCGECIRSLEYIVSKEEEKQQKQQKIIENTINTTLPLSDLYINRDDNLNPRYTFDSFVIGSFNEVADAASKAIIKNPGAVYNPLFVYGETGIGKTHLIQAIGNEIKKNNLGKKVYYVTSEKFSMDYINSLQTSTVNEFKEKYRKYDVFIMDDTQFLSNKEKTQEELFHLFNVLYEENKQVIFSSDIHPNYIPNLEARLKSRFSAGMIIDIQQPEYESRMAILRSKANINNISINDDVVDYMASSINGNIRELEGILNLVICQSRIKNRSITLNEVRVILKNNVKQKKSVSIKDVVKIVSDFYEIEEGDIYEKTRRREVVKPRQVIMYLLRKDFGVSYPTIGQKIGGRDHTTAIHSYDKINKSLLKDSLLTQELDQIRAMF